MKKTKSGKQLICFVLTIILIVTCFPIGVVGGMLNDNDSWTAQAGLKTSYYLTANDVSTGTLIPAITFSDDATYNGSPQSLAKVDPIPDGPELNPERIEISYQGTEYNGDVYSKTTNPPTDVGSYTVVAGYEGDDAYTNYSETKEIKIKPIELKTADFFTEKPVNKIYDGTNNVPENTIIGLSNTGVINSDRDKVEFNFKTASFFSKDVKPPGFNMVTLKGVTIVGDKGKEYLIVEENKETKPLKSIDISLGASVLPKPVEVILVGQDKVYDGNASLHSYELTVNQGDLIQGEEAGASATENFYPWYGDVNTQEKNVGNYYVWATGGYYIYGVNGTNGDNYISKDDTIASKKKHAINPAAVTVIPSYVSKIQEDSDPALTYVVWQDESGDGFIKGLYGDDVLYGSLEREAGEALGTYDVYLGSLNNSNYSISLVDGKDKFEILKREGAVAVYFGNDYYNDVNGTGEAEEEKEKVAYFRIALMLLLLIVGGAFFGKNRLTKMD